MTNTALTLIETLKKESMQASQAERDKQRAAILEAELEAERQYWKALEPFTEEYEIMTDLSAEDLNTNEKVTITHDMVAFILESFSLPDNYSLPARHTLRQFEIAFLDYIDDEYEDDYMAFKEVFDAHILLRMGLIAVSKDRQFWLTERGITFLDLYNL